MEKIENYLVPESIEEAIQEVLKIMRGQAEQMKDFGQDERRFLGRVHMSLGMNLRNRWLLHWAPKHKVSTWPAEPPKLVKEFIDLGIEHGDDRSGILLTSAFRRYHKKDEDIPGQVQHYKDFWAKSQEERLRR